MDVGVTDNLFLAKIAKMDPGVKVVENELLFKGLCSKKSSGLKQITYIILNTLGKE